MAGRLIISLDFELHWGVRDHSRVEDYADNLAGVRHAIPVLLAEFKRRGIHATWATVGFLCFRSRHELLEALPRELPTYSDPVLDPYRVLDQVGADEDADPFHFGESLVRSIVGTPGQELATHTFSHFYCMEPGQTRAQFSADLSAAAAAAARFGVALRSIVFPRNQVNEDYLGVLSEHGIRAFRGNPDHFAYRAVRGADERRRRRAARLIDTYFPLTGPHNRPPSTHGEGPVNIPASLFLRPVPARGTRWLERARLARILTAMRRAAQDGLDFHLWWHPHNFGTNLRANMTFLNEILDEFGVLRRRTKMQSVSMADAAGPP